jgi:heme o synthase
MKTFMLDIENISAEPVTVKEKLVAFFELTKPRITFFIILTSAFGYVLAADPVNFTGLAHISLAVGMLCSGVSTLNQYMERHRDALMKRTVGRPLPTGRVSATQALCFGLALVAAAELYLLFFVNLLSAVLGLSVILGYVVLYTPLKTRTTLSTFVGAFPGAMPPVIGWSAATGDLTIETLILFLILFLWQFPHFLAIAWMYREDYSRAGILMLPVIDTKGHRTARQIIANTILLLFVSLLPVTVGLTNINYLPGAVILGSLFLYFGVRMAIGKTRRSARMLLLASVVYLPILLVLMLINSR